MPAATEGSEPICDIASSRSIRRDGREADIRCNVG